jgi:hypothetical protein
VSARPPGWPSRLAPLTASTRLAQQPVHETPLLLHGQVGPGGEEIAAWQLTRERALGAQPGEILPGVVVRALTSIDPCMNF